MRRRLAMLAAGCAGSVAAAQPEVVEDLGVLASPASVTRVVGIPFREVAWFRLALPVVTHPTRYLDVWTDAAPAEQAPLLSNADTVIALYDATGARVALDDQDGPLSFSALSFGAASPVRPAVGGSLAFNGRDGALAAGTYYLAVASFRTDYALTGWGTTVFSTHSGNVSLRLELGCFTCPTSPVCAGAASPGRVAPGQGALVTAAVTVGQFPTSSGLVVSADLRPIGGPAVATLRDDGQGGDLIAGDRVFSRMIIAPLHLAGASVTLPIAVSDAQGRASACSATLEIAPETEWFEAHHGGGDAGQHLFDAQHVTGSVGLTTIEGETGEFDADAFVIRIVDLAGFSATVETNTPGADPMVFLFDACEGRGVVSNDDAPPPDAEGTHARIGPALVPRLGVYVLAVSGFGLDPFDDFGLAMWGLRVPRTESAADSVRPLWAWFGQATPMRYRIALTGCERISPGANPCTCPADFDGNGVVDPDDLGDFINCYFALVGACPRADFNASGTVDPDDLGDFINAYFGQAGQGGGCP